MNRIPVKSSNVRSVGWAPGEQEGIGTLEVEFMGGQVYIYADVPESEYQALLGATSVGKHLNARIIGQYDERFSHRSG
jgi:hypothetical protein